MNVKNKIFFLGILIVASLQSARSASFSIYPQEAELKQNCETIIDIMIDTQNQEVSAADMILISNTGELEISCFIPGDFFSVAGGLQKKENRSLVTSFQYPGVVNGSGKFGSLIIKSLGNTQSTNIYFEVNGIGLEKTAGDSNISRPGGGDLLTSAGFGKYTFVPGECKEIPQAIKENCKSYDKSEGFDKFMEKYEKDIKGKNFFEENREFILGIIFALIGILLIKAKTKLLGG